MGVMYCDCNHYAITAIISKHIILDITSIPTRMLYKYTGPVDCCVYLHDPNVYRQLTEQLVSNNKHVKVGKKKTKQKN